ncbi:MAG: hypothetical protein QNI95_01745 [Desulfobacterales bacterium]|nr:hypothetical protein [Desulfobacterales bacterium]
MKPIPFNSQKDMAPIPFDAHICRLAGEMKDFGLPWQPHVGCFVWDPEGYIEADSPFPDRVYFILSMPRFLQIFGNVEQMVAKLVWLPTWHQARLLCDRLGVGQKDVSNIFESKPSLSAGQELQSIYKLIVSALQK